VYRVGVTDQDRYGSSEQPGQVKGALVLLALKTLFGCVSLGSAAALVRFGGLEYGYPQSADTVVLIVIVGLAVAVGEFVLSLAAVIILRIGRGLLAWRTLVAVCVVLLVENVAVMGIQIVTSVVTSGSMPESGTITALVIWSALTIGALALILTRPVRESFVPDPTPVQPAPALAADGLDRAERGE
jgi:hypothetical protein